MPLLNELPTRIVDALVTVAPALTNYTTALTVSPPSDLGGENNEPTLVIIAGVPKSGVRGSWEVVYNRTNLAVHLKHVRLNVDLTALTDPAVFCTYLTTRYGIESSVEDFVFPSTPLVGAAFETFTLRASPTSYRFVGAVVLHHWVDLSAAIPEAPIYVSLPPEIDAADVYSKPLDFTGLSVIANTTAANFDGVQIAVALLEESGDDWFCTDGLTPYNLYNAEFLSNEEGCLKIRLVPEYSELHGILSLNYEVSPE